VTREDIGQTSPDLDLGLLAVLEPAGHTARVDDPRYCVCGELSPCGREPVAVLLGSGGGE
jgi:hypothetical protein